MTCRKPLLEKVNLLEPTACDGMTDIDRGAGVALVKKAFEDAMKTQLLAQHSRVGQSSPAIAYYKSFGCKATSAGAWHPGPGPTGPLGCPGCGPWIPNYPGGYFCNIDWIANAGGTTCRCITEGISLDPSGRVIRVRNRCESCTGCGLTTGPGIGWNPAPTVPGTPPTGCPTTCPDEHFY